MKKIIAIFTGLMISIMLAFAATTVFETDQVIYTVMPKYGPTEIGSVPLITSQQVANITTDMVTNNQPNVTFGSITVSNVVNATRIYTNSTPIVFSASATNSAVTNIGQISASIIKGKLYINSTNGLTGSPVVFQSTAELMVTKTATVQSDRILGLYTNMGMVCVTFTNNMPQGSTNLFLTDTSAFSPNNLLFLMGSNEFVRIKSISSTTNVQLRTPTLYGHAITNGVSRVREFGSLDYYDATGSNNFYTTTTFGTDLVTVNLNLDIEYR
jgi:hypothetical protein